MDYTLNVGAVRWFTTGADAGGTAHLRSFDMAPAQIAGPLGSFLAEPSSFAGGVRVAAADVDGDGYADVITGAGPGGGPHVRVWSAGSGSTLQELTGFFAYDPAFGGGVFVAAPTPVHRMAIDIAPPNSSLSGAVTIAGWAFNEAAGPKAIGVSAIHVWAYPSAGGAATFRRDDGRDDGLAIVPSIA